MLRAVLGARRLRTVRLESPIQTTQYVRSILLLVGTNETPTGPVGDLRSLSLQKLRFHDIS